MKKIIFCYVAILCSVFLTIYPVFAREIQVGFDRNFPPFSYINDQGLPTGFDIDLVELIFYKSPYSVRFKSLQWDTVQMELAGNSVQMAIGFMKNKGTESLFILSNKPYYTAHFTVFGKKNLPIQTLRSLQGKLIGAKKNSFAQKILRTNEDIKIQSFSSDMEGIRAVSDDTIENYFGLEDSIRWNIKKGVFQGIVRSGFSVYDCPIYFAVNKENKSLADYINKRFRALVQSGAYDKLYSKWFSADISVEQQRELVRLSKECATKGISFTKKDSTGCAILTENGKIYTGVSLFVTKDAYIDSVESAVTAAIKEGNTSIVGVVVSNAIGRVERPTKRALELLHKYDASIRVLVPNSKGSSIWKGVGELFYN